MSASLNIGTWYPGKCFSYKKQQHIGPDIPISTDVVAQQVVGRHLGEPAASRCPTVTCDSTEWCERLFESRPGSDDRGETWTDAPGLSSPHLGAFHPFKPAHPDPSEDQSEDLWSSALAQASFVHVCVQIFNVPVWTLKLYAERGPAKRWGWY